MTSRKEQYERTERLLGGAAMERLARARVAVFGIGGVGGYVCEALVRSGIGAFDLVDADHVALSNLNRQIIATRDTVGRYKTEVMRDRMLSIDPDVQVRIYNTFFLPENADGFPFSEYDYVVDAVDTVTAKVELILRAKAAGVPVISAMGAGNKLDAQQMKVADIYETQTCPLARVMRRELRKRGVKDLKVVYSEEEPMTPAPPTPTAAEAAPSDPAAEMTPAPEAETGTAPEDTGNTGRPEPAPFSGKKRAPGSTAFVPAVCGLLIAGEVVKDLTREARNK